MWPWSVSLPCHGCKSLAVTHVHTLLKLFHIKLPHWEKRDSGKIVHGYIPQICAVQAPLPSKKCKTPELSRTGREAQQRHYRVYDSSRCRQSDSSGRQGECSAEQTSKAGPLMSNGCWAAGLWRFRARCLWQQTLQDQEAQHLQQKHGDRETALNVSCAAKERFSSSHVDRWLIPKQPQDIRQGK